MKKTVLKIWLNNCWTEVFPETDARLVKRSDGITNVESSLQQIEDKLDDALVGVYKYQGQVNTFEELPTEAQNGFVYEVLAEHEGYEAGTNWVWDGSKWDPMSANLTRLESKSTVTVGGEPVETFDADTKVNAKVNKYSGYWLYGNYTNTDGSFIENNINARAFKGNEDPKVSTIIPLYNGDGTLSGSDPKEDYNYATMRYADTKVPINCPPMGRAFVQGVYVYNYNNDVALMQTTTGSGTADETYRRLAFYNDNANIGSPNDPIQDFEYCRKGYTDTKVASLVGNADIANGDRVYVHIKKADGTDQDESRGLKWNEGGGEPTVHYNGAIPQYSNGYIAVRTPDSSKPFAAANVKYVDEKCGTPVAHSFTYSEELGAFVTRSFVISQKGCNVAIAVNNAQYGASGISYLTPFQLVFSTLYGWETGYFGDGNDNVWQNGVAPNTIYNIPLLLQTNKGEESMPQYQLITAKAIVDSVANYSDYGTDTTLRFYDEQGTDVTSKVAHAPIVLVK